MAERRLPEAEESSKAGEGEDVAEPAQKKARTKDGSPEASCPASSSSSSATCAASAAAPADSAEREVVTVSSSGDFWRVQLEAIYRRRNPHKLEGVPGLLEKYKGKEVVLYAKVCKTYDLDAKRFYADPKSWEEYETDTTEKVSEEPTTEVTAALPPTGGGVPIANLFGMASSGLGPVSGPLFAAGKKKAAATARGGDSDSDSGDGAPAAPAAEKQPECKTQ